MMGISDDVRDGEELMRAARSGCSSYPVAREAKSTASRSWM
jgi:hypothetical protein